MARPPPPHLKVVGDTTAPPEGIDIPDEVVARWRQAMDEVLRDGGITGIILYRNAIGTWGITYTPDMALDSAWGLLDTAHYWLERRVKPLDDLDDEE